MANGTRNCDRQFAAWVDVAKKRFGYCSTALLAEIPALEYHGHFLHKIPKSERPSVEDHCDNRLAELRKRIDQFVLLANQIQARSVAQMIQHPGFARCLLVAANGQ